MVLTVLYVFTDLKKLRVEGEGAVEEEQREVQERYLRSGSEAGSYLRLIDACITQLKAQGPSRTCNESNEEEEEKLPALPETIQRW